MIKRMNIGKYICVGLLLAGTSFGITFTLEAKTEAIPLAGEWRFKLDPADEGVTGSWFNTTLPDSTVLPGSTDENGYGTPVTGDDTYRLSRIYKYVGPAWYQRTVVIPAGWSGKRIVLMLERCGWETRVWVDGNEIGTAQNSLSVMHEHDLTVVLL